MAEPEAEVIISVLSLETWQRFFLLINSLQLTVDEMNV